MLFQAGCADDTGHIERLTADLEEALRDKDDLQEVLDVRNWYVTKSSNSVDVFCWVNSTFRPEI